MRGGFDHSIEIGGLRELGRDLSSIKFPCNRGQGNNDRKDFLFVI